MTAKKNKPRPPTLRQQLDAAMAGNKALQEQLEMHQKRDTNQCEVGRAEEPRRHATPSGPNLPSDIYPPACGPMQLVWSVDRYDQVSFHVFGSRQEAVEWLCSAARRIETGDDGKAEALLRRGAY